MRFQVTYCIDRQGLRWAEETFTSYEQDPVDPQLEQDVVAECRLAVSSFLSRHDPGFRDAETDPVAVRPETSRPSIGLPQAPCCIPLAADASRSPSTPGYIIELFLRSRCQTTSKAASFRIESRQVTPLTVLLGENVLSKATKLLDVAFEERKIRFDEVHRWCDGLEGSGGCSHVVDGAFDALVKIRNSIGPDYNHLSHRLQTCRVLFDQDEAHEFDDLATYLKEQLESVRDLADRGLNAVDDLTFNVRKIEGLGHLILNPIRISLDASATHNRNTTQALVNRVKSGIPHLLKGTGASLSLTVHKRGHLILDTVIRDPTGSNSSNAEHLQATTDRLLTEIKEQLRADITMLCKDTCSLDCADLPISLKLFDARTSTSDDNRPSTSGPMMPDEAPVTPTRQSLSKRKAQPNLRQVSMSEPRRRPSASNEFIQAHSYMADLISDDAYLTDDSSTPSLVDTDSISPQDSILITPESSRVGTRGPPTFGIRLMDDDLMGAPISTQDIVPPHEEMHATYDAPPFQNAFGSSKSSPDLPTSICSDGIETVVPPQSKDAQASSNTSAGPLNIAHKSEMDQVPPCLVDDTQSIHHSFNSEPEILAECSSSSNPDSDVPIVTSAMPKADVTSALMTEPIAPEHVSKDHLAILETEEESAIDSINTEMVTETQPPIRPSLSITQERPKSSALIVRAGPTSFYSTKRERTNSILDSKPERRWSSPRPAFHRRQFSSPTAGYLGLHGEYLVEMGLMNAVIPSHLRSVQP
jgi:hypothetical protein